MKYDILYNFISSTTGRVLSIKDYALIGDRLGIATPSSILIDLKLELYKLVRNVEILNNIGLIVRQRGMQNAYALDDLVEGFLYNKPQTIDANGNIVPGVLSIKDIQIAKFILQTAHDALPQAQSLGALTTGLLKNTVTTARNADGSDGIQTGTLSRAESGRDYVNTSNFLLGNLVVIDPTYTPDIRGIPGQDDQQGRNKFIAPAPIGLAIAFAALGQFGATILNSVQYLEGTLARFTKLAIKDLEPGTLLKIGNNNFHEVVPATPGTDYVVPNNINGKLDKLTEIVKLLVGVDAATQLLDITPDQASTLNKVVKAIGGIDDTMKMVDVQVTEAKYIANAVKSAVGLKVTDSIKTAATTALDITEKASLLQMEAQIAALAGVEAIDILGTILGFVGLTAGGTAYGEYIRGQTLNVKNTWHAADDNDEGHNAVGDFEFWKVLSAYSSKNRGHGTLWFDSDGRSNNSRSEAGLRLFSWDSGGDKMGNDDPIAPLHIGLFGYQNKYSVLSNPTPIYKGFIFSIPEFHNESSSDDNYRFPKKFGLYDVTKTIRSLTTDRYGWDDNKTNTVFEYDYNNFKFFKPVKLSVSESPENDEAVSKGYVDANTKIQGTDHQIVVTNQNNVKTISLANNVKLPGEWVTIPVSNTDFSNIDTSINQQIMLRFNPNL